MGILIEHYAGKFPVWLAPVQITILPISDRFNDYAYDLMKQLKDRGLRVEVDDRAEKIGYKIREARLQRVPYMFIVGEKEVNENLVSVRSRDRGDLGQVSLEEAIAKIEKEIETKAQ